MNFEMMDSEHELRVPSAKSVWRPKISTPYSNVSFGVPSLDMPTSLVASEHYYYTTVTTALLVLVLMQSPAFIKFEIEGIADRLF